MLSIISITKDDFAGIKATIESTRSIRKEFEVKQIVVDSSKIEFAKEIEAICNEENNIEYFWTEPKGISAAFNYGISKANSEWLWFLNGGDSTLEQLDKYLLLGILKNTSSDVLSFQLKSEGKIKEYKIPPLLKIWPPFWIFHPSTIFKRDLFEKFGNFNPSYKIAMDFDLWLRFLTKGISVDIISFPIAFFRSGGISEINTKLLNTEKRNILTNYFFSLIFTEMKDTFGIIKTYTKLLFNV